MKELLGQAKVRDATVAGIFYPDDPTELESRISALLQAAKPSVSGASAIFSPHAGLDYSGDLSALAWKSAAGRRIDRILVLCPLHRAEDTFIYLPESDYYDLPTGRIRVDQDTVAELRDCGTLMSVNDIPHLEEHGIELQLPFMLELFPDARLVPILVGKPTLSLIKALASALSIVFEGKAKSTLIVVSSDLGSSDEEHIAAAHADRFLRSFLAEDGASIAEGIESGDICACGAACIAAYLQSSLAKGKRPVLLGRHDSSASRETGEERLVHYGAVAFVDA
jgi:MEMO1 family protein